MSSFYKYRRLLADLSAHAALAAVLSYFLYAVYSDYILVFLVIAGSVFVDIDHFGDYFLNFGFKFDARKFFFGEYLKLGRIYFFFHSWELVLLIYLIITFLGYSRYAAVLSLAIAGHLLIDSFFQKRFLPYSLAYRIFHGFDLYKILPALIKKSST